MVNALATRWPTVAGAIHFIVMLPFHRLQSICTVAFENSLLKTSLPAAVSLHSPAAPAAGSP